MKRIRLEEARVDGFPLGRHVEHDERSRAFQYVSGETGASPVLGEVIHRRHGKVLDQLNLGSCTGNAAAGAVNTEPIYNRHHKLLREDQAVSLYSLATQLDGFDGTYPPDDPGSSGLAAAKAAKQLGYIKSYYWAFGIDQALTALQLRPVITGVPWFEGFDRPDEHGFVKIDGQIRGGHEFEVVGYHPTLADNPQDALVEAVNSWGPDWGLGGHFFFTVGAWGSLLEMDGDVTVLIR